MAATDLCRGEAAWKKNIGAAHQIILTLSLPALPPAFCPQPIALCAPNSPPCPNPFMHSQVPSSRHRLLMPLFQPWLILRSPCRPATFYAIDPPLADPYLTSSEINLRILCHCNAPPPLQCSKISPHSRFQALGHAVTCPRIASPAAHESPRKSSRRLCAFCMSRSGGGIGFSARAGKPQSKKDSVRTEERRMDRVPRPGHYAQGDRRLTQRDLGRSVELYASE